MAATVGGGGDDLAPLLAVCDHLPPAPAEQTDGPAPSEGGPVVELAVPSERWP
jgi:hypothetical protein